MKKVLAIAIAGVWAIASCSKDYTCKCTTTVDGVSSDTTYIVTKTNVTKSDAEASCNKNTATKKCAII